MNILNSEAVASVHNQIKLKKEPNHRTEMMVTKQMLLLLVPLLIDLVSAENSDYCSFTRRHTACRAKGFGKKCGKVINSGLDENEIREILHAHNKLRALVANGQEKRGNPGPQPSSSDMMELEWDEELAFVAQKHADQCTFAHDCNNCRKVERFGVGQNLYISRQTLRSPKTDWSLGIQKWFDEVTLFSRNDVKPFRFSAEIGHYSAMIWSSTNKIGCGKSEYLSGSAYTIGSPCSECKDSVCSTKYPGLCQSNSARNSTLLTNSIDTTTKKEEDHQQLHPPQQPRKQRAPLSNVRQLLSSFLSNNQLSGSEEEKESCETEAHARELFSCNFVRNVSLESTPCDTKFSGKEWLLTTLANAQGEPTDSFYEPPRGGVACLSFRYKKKGANSLPLKVLAWPYKSRPGVVSIVRNSTSSRWIRAQITFRKILNFFIITFKANGFGLTSTYLAIDDVILRDGECA
ncbi:CRISP [Lepeophtheirus salmonis]|uniref:CRISP n=1 Tax=Lepeophtheirus salmonis TaxID=72036 RepID=A0A7R8CBT5_LEPSM|nr:CRISP [Lepeophtheirus salmonis]CAF2761139.1 CRISP [Lepeophtheirus salmonis]